MRKLLKSKFALLILAIGFLCGIGFSRINTKFKLDKHYIEQFKLVKARMIWGDSVDTREELNDYHDQIERSMYLDGYNGLEIMKIRKKAFKLALEERSPSK